MDPVALEKAFELYPDVKVVVVANLYGTPAKLDEIVAVCNAHHAVLIEDAAESLGATYKGKQTGTFGAYNAISLVGVKDDTGKSRQNKCQYRAKIVQYAQNMPSVMRKSEFRQVNRTGFLNAVSLAVSCDIRLE